MKRLSVLQKIGVWSLVIGLGSIGAYLTRDVPFVSHQKYFYIRCVDASGKVTYEVKSTEYPVSNALKGLGTCSYVYR
jgi:hypothetical protein